MSRSSQVGWGPNNTFYRSAFQGSDEAGMSPNSFVLKKHVCEFLHVNILMQDDSFILRKNFPILFILKL